MRKRLIQYINRLEIEHFKIQFRSIGCNLNIGHGFVGHSLSNISIGDNFRADKRLKLRTFSEWCGQTFKPEIIIGNNVSLESDCHISAINRVEIGNDVLIASFVYISDHSHGEILSEEIAVPPIKRKLFSKGPIIIKDRVWIGEKVCILPNVTIGEGAIIGAGSVVTHDIPAGAVAVGNPAKVIRKL